METNIVWDSSSPSDDQTASIDENAAVTPISYAESFSASLEDECAQVVVHVCSFATEPKSGSTKQTNVKLNSIVESPRFSPIPEKSGPEFNGNLSADLMNDVGESIRVSADISGRSTPEVNWYMNGNPILANFISGDEKDDVKSGDPIRFEREGNIHSLVMKDFLMDEGSWKISCMAVNSMGVAKSSIMLGHHTETQYLSASQTQLFEHTEEDEDSDRQSGKENNQSADSDGIFEIYSPSISDDSCTSSKQLVQKVCKFSAKMKVCLFGKGLICETQIEKKHQKMVDVMWLLDERVIKQSEFSRMLENEYNDIFALELSNINILSRETKNLTCVVTLNGSHMHQTTNISNIINEIANDGCELFFLEGSLKTQDLLLFHHFNREIIIAKSISEMTAQYWENDEDDDDVIAKGSICFQVDVDCKDDESDSLNPIWLVDGEIVLAQKSYLSEINENCCRLIILSTEYQLKVSRVDFYLVCACGINVEVIHRATIKPQLIGKPYLEIIDNCQMLLVEVPLDSCPSPIVECFVNEDNIESFQWEYSTPDQMCSVVFQEVLSVSHGDVRIVLSNPIGSLSVTLTREQIQRLQQKVEQRRKLRRYKHSNDITRKIKQRENNWTCNQKQRLFQSALHQIKRSSQHALSPDNFKTSAMIEMGHDRKTTLKTVADNCSRQVVPYGGHKSSPDSSFHIGALNLNRETFSIILTKNCTGVLGFPEFSLTAFVPFGSKLKLTSLSNFPTKWICTVSPHKNEDLPTSDDNSNDSNEITTKKVTALIIMCEYSGLMSDDDVTGRNALYSADWPASATNQSVPRISQSEHMDNEPFAKQCRKTSLLFLSGSNPSLNNGAREADPQILHVTSENNFRKENGEAVITKKFHSDNFVRVASELCLNIKPENQHFESNLGALGKEFDRKEKNEFNDKHINLLGQHSISSIKLSSIALNDIFHEDDFSDSSDSSDDESFSDSELNFYNQCNAKFQLKPNDEKVSTSFQESLKQPEDRKKPGLPLLNTEEKQSRSYVEDYRKLIISKLLETDVQSSCENISPFQEEIEVSVCPLNEQQCYLQSHPPSIQYELIPMEAKNPNMEDARSKENLRQEDLVCENTRGAQIQKDIADTYVIEGETMVLQLVALNADRCEWLKDGRNIFGRRFSEKSNLKEGNVSVHELHWKSVKEWEDGVRFSCQVWDEKEGKKEMKLVSKEATLHIVSKPSIALPRRFLDGIIKLSRGDPFSVSLSLDGRPEPKWSWKKVEFEATVVISEGIGDKAELKIDTLEKSDSGLYILEATNDYGIDEKRLEIIVEGPPAPVTNLTVTDVGRRLRLRWDPPVDSASETPIKTYHIQGRFTYTPKWRNLAKSRENACFLDYLPDISWLRVIAENANGLDEEQEHPEVKVVAEELIQQVPEPKYAEQQFGLNDFESCDTKVLIGKFGSNKAFKCTSRPNKKWIEVFTLTRTCLFCNKVVQILIHEKQSFAESSVFLDFLHMKTSEDPILGDVSRYYLQCSDLTDFFDPEGWLSSNSEKQIAANVSQMLLAIEFLHDRNFLYLSLHPVSLALDKQNGFSIKLLRFSYTTRTDPSLSVKFFRYLDEFFGPEILNQLPVGRHGDSWAVGAMAYFMLTGDLIAPSDVKDGSYSVDINNSLISAEAMDFVKQMVQFSPSNRSSVKCALSHKWFEYGGEISRAKKASPSTVRNVSFKALKHKMKSLISMTQSTSIYGTLTYMDTEEPKRLLYCSIGSENAAPFFVEKPAENIGARLGDDISLECIVSALSPPVITWNFLDNELRPGLKYRISYASLESKFGTDRQMCSLRITKCQYSDSGDYFCEANNCYGSSIFKIAIDVS